MLSRRANSGGAFFGFLAGVFTAVLLFLFNQQWVVEAVGATRLFQREKEFLYFSMWSFLVAVSVTMLVSYALPPEPQEKLKFVLSRRPMEATS